MSRLIDADALIEKLKRTSAFECIRNSADKNVFEIIAEQPTAYDIEKVVAELETELRVTRNVQSIECIKNDGYGTSRQAKNSGKIEMLLKAIGIVKAGGVK